MEKIENTQTRYWCVGHTQGGGKSQLPRFVKDGIWDAWFNDKVTGQRQLELAKKIKKGDIVILRTFLKRDIKQNIAYIRVLAIGEVTNEEGSIRKEDTWTIVSYKVNYFWQGDMEFKDSKYNLLQRIINEYADKEIINHINSVRNDEPTRKYAKYIELLEQNKNLVLTGAPGTGKTFMAKAIAKEMGCSDDEMAFVQFHPSYDYTDFVEGLRPVRDSDNFGFELRNGVFKDFCAKALQNFKDSNQAAKKSSVEVSKVDTKNYVFIIDEINRGDISKIFGELFFAIDPGYRGERGKVNTQYQNIIEDGDPFKDGFFVPENVYIIGTMNDIDRSVENMDFAMRRRFSWVEVTPNDTESMLDELSCVEEAKETMERLNKAIEETEGLGSAYMIGPAYFRKLGENGGDFDKLWKMNIEPLLREYLRGFRKTGDIMNQLSMAYFGKKEEEHSNTPELTDEN